VNCVPATVLLQIVPIAIKTPAGVKVDTFALLDSGSQTSLIVENFANTVGVDGENGGWTVSQLNLPPQKVTRTMVATFPHLNDLNIPEGSSEDITVPLGANMLEAILQRDVRHASHNSHAC